MHRTRKGLRIAIWWGCGIFSYLIMWSLWPVRATLEGKGSVRPVFESLVKVVPPESGVVCNVSAERLKEVRTGDVLLEYVPMNKAHFLTYSRMTPPGGSNEPDPVPEWFAKVERQRKSRLEAANRWQGALRKPGQRPQEWEYDLANRLVMIAAQQGDMERLLAQQRENIRVGHEASNRIHVFDQALGQTVPAEHGIPIASPADGTLYSLWAQPVMQISGSLSPDLPTPVSGGPPMIAVAAATVGKPVAEILPPGAPREVLALVPVSSRLLELHNGWRAVLAGAGLQALEVTNIDFGKVPISPADAELLVPELANGKESVFVRLRFKEGSSGELDSTVQVRLITPKRPRAWFWFAGA